ncbi:MAG: division/cell wall cluster transcriptional repressor MraZ, partial [Rickettsiaceae bacterium]|nr:division/cell wall cluster transcriptional repressor MraZ [Rickettsiaceae bacterium]
AVQLTIDGEGRVVLPKTLCEYTMLEDQALFVGKGLVFELWNPSQFNEYALEAREIAKNNRLLLKNL